MSDTLVAAGTAYAGVPAGCFMSTDDIPDFWNSTCSTGQSTWTQQQWTSVAEEMYPGYTGPRPKMLIYHGSADETLDVQNYYETIQQWTGVFGYSATAVSTPADFPRSPYTKYVFGDKLQTFLGTGVTHSTDVFPEEDLKWFGFVTPPSSTTSWASTTTLSASTTSSASATTTSSAGRSGNAAHWASCGGNGWTGVTACASPYTCVKVNDCYFQCQ